MVGVMKHKPYNHHKNSMIDPYGDFSIGYSGSGDGDGISKFYDFIEEGDGWGDPIINGLKDGDGFGSPYSIISCEEKIICLIR